MKFAIDIRRAKLFYAALFIISVSLGVFAQNDKPKVSADEAKAAKKIQDAKTFPEIAAASDEFLKKYPQSSYRKQINEYLAGQVFASKDDNQSVTNAQTFTKIFTEPAESDIIVPALVDALIRLKRSDEAFAAGDKYLPRHEDDVTVRLQLAVEGSNQLRTGNNKYVAQTKGYSTQAIVLIEANKKPANLSDEDWKGYQTKWLPELYTALGFASFASNDKAKAQIYFEKTVALDQTNVTGWYLLGNVLNENYQDLAQSYNKASGSEKDGLLAKANEALDKVIDAFAHVTALTDGNPTYQALNTQVRQDLESYYKYRRKSTDGLQDLINKYKPKAN